MAKKVVREHRKSSLRGYEEFLNSFDDDIDFSTFIDPYTQIQEEYYEIAKKRLPKCYKITYRTVPDAFFIAFDTKDRAKSKATKFFRDNFHPAFMGNSWKKLHTEARAIRMPSLDKYWSEGKVPIPEVMKCGVTFPCSICGKGNFNLYDLENQRCHIVEGEGDINLFTKGYLLCGDCYHKYIA